VLIGTIPHAQHPKHDHTPNTTPSPQPDITHRTTHLVHDNAGAPDVRPLAADVVGHLGAAVAHRAECARNLEGVGETARAQCTAVRGEVLPRGMLALHPALQKAPPYQHLTNPVTNPSVNSQSVLTSWSGCRNSALPKSMTFKTPPEPPESNMMFSGLHRFRGLR